jgi:hypothetical protein
MSTTVFISLIFINRLLPILSPRSPVYVKLCLNISLSSLFVQCRIMLSCQLLATQSRYSTLLSEPCISCFLTHTHTDTNIHKHTMFLSHMNQLTTSMQPFPVMFPFFCPDKSCTQTYPIPHIVILNSVATLAPHLRCWTSATSDENHPVVLYQYLLYKKQSKSTTSHIIVILWQHVSAA